MALETGKIILANWKMQLSYQETIDLAEAIKKELKKYKTEKLEIGLCADFMTIPKLSEILKNTQIKLGCQNIFWEDRGAYTGEILIDNLKNFNVHYAIIGHSERRKFLHESGEMINKKVKRAIENKIVPILCVGENFEQRRNGQKDLTIIKQIRSALSGIKINNIEKVIIAYEPIWVIGSGQAIQAEEAEHTNKVIKEIVLDVILTENENLGRKELENKIKFIYGGSVDASNISNFIRQKNIQGVLVGGASLKKEKFINLINAII